MEKELTIRGLHGTLDEERLFDYLNNQEHLTLIASEDAPAFLDEQVTHMANDKRVKPSVIWLELIEAGARTLITKWKSNDSTNVGKALDRIHSTGEMYSLLHRMVRAYEDTTGGFYQGCQAFAILQSAPYLNDWEDEDEAYIDNFCREWGLDFSDACMLFAAVEGKKRGLKVLYNELLELTEKYLREKVWFIDALVNQAQHPLPKSVMEIANDLLYASKGVADNG